MGKEKNEKHESKHEPKTITIKKDTLWKSAVFILSILLVLSIFTGGFGIKKTGYVADTGSSNNGNVASNSGSSKIDTSIFVSNPKLYPSLGPSNAKAIVIELADFQCPFCALASGLSNWTAQYTSKYGDFVGAAKNIEQSARQGKIRFIFVPLSIMGKESIYATEATFCAYDQNPSLFWDMHDAIYKASNGPQENTGKYSKANLEIIAQGISGLNLVKFKSCLESDTNLARVQQVVSDVKKSGIRAATPQFFVNGKLVKGSWAIIQSAINSA